MNRNQPSTFNPRRLVIAALVLIVIITALLFWGQDVIREVVVIPLSYVFWGIGILVRTTPQIFFWITALLITLMIAYHSLSDRKKVTGVWAGSLNDQQPDVPTSGRAAFWISKASLLRDQQGSYGENNFHRAVVRMLVELLAYRYRLPARAVEDEVLKGSLDVPPQVTQYLRDHLRQAEPVLPGFWGQTWETLTRWAVLVWQKLTADPARSRAVAINAELAFILNYMEEELEVLHDDTGR